VKKVTCLETVLLVVEVEDLVVEAKVFANIVFASHYDLLKGYLNPEKYHLK